MNQFITSLHPPIAILILLWLIHLLDAATRYGLTHVFCLRPRHVWGLIGIATSPLLHADFRHLMTNSGAFLVLGWLIAIQGVNMFLFVSIVLAVAVGLILWLLSPSPVIGASGVIFGYLGFLVMYGLTIDSGLPQAAGFVGLVLYGGIWIGIFPNDPQVSWLAHAAGFVCGIGLGHWMGLRAIELGVVG